MILSELSAYVASFVSGNITKIQGVTGGDINDAYRVSTSQKEYFLKVNHFDQALDAFNCESLSLEVLAKSTTLIIPKPIKVFPLPQIGAGFLMTFIPHGKPNQNYWINLAEGLAQIHRKNSARFGWEKDNYIGTIPQPNNETDNWPDFYFNYRIWINLLKAHEESLITTDLLKKAEILKKRIAENCPNEPPSLIHGDLWGGNKMSDESGDPVLIDPSCYYGHRELDLAMSHLFGGFHAQFYDHYQEIYPLAPGLEKRLDLYQLYYLIIHVLLFGGSYVTSVHNIITKYQ